MRSPQKAKVEKTNYENLWAFCDHMSNGVFVILGGVAAGSMDIIHSFSKTFHMPYVTHNTKHKSAGDIDGYVLKMRPSHSEAIRDLIQRYKWKNIHYIYNSDDGKFENYWMSYPTRFSTDMLR
ncbi:hypothetical protein ScPMuIL_011199 [Solemya velum]